MKLQFFSDCVSWPLDQVDDLSAMIRDGKEISRSTFLKSVNPEEMRDLERQMGYERDPRKGLTMAKDWAVAYYRSTVRGCPAVYFVWSAIEHVFTDLACLRPPMMGAAGNVAPVLYHGTMKEHLPAILEQGIARGEGWGGANTSGAFLSGSPEGALYWAKIAYQRERGEKVEPDRFNRVHGHEADQLLAVVTVQVPDDQVDRLKADEEQFEDVGADFSPDDWRQSLEKIGDVRFEGEIPPAWIRDVIPPSAIEKGAKMSGQDPAPPKTFTLVEQSTKEAPFRDIQEGHPVLRAVERVLDGPSHYRELEVGQKMTVRIRASGTSGVYSIWRTA
jgi:hypothetical protein